MDFIAGDILSSIYVANMDIIYCSVPLSGWMGWDRGGISLSLVSYYIGETVILK